MNRSTKADKPDAKGGLASVVGWAAGIFIGALRLIPHPWNFSSIGSLGLFGGARLRWWQACALPLAILAATDVALWLLNAGNPLYAPWHITRLYVYPAILGYVLIGYVLRQKASWQRVAVASLLGSAQFFLVTNFCFWLLQPWEAAGSILPEYIYSRNLAGLLTCYAKALPFYSPTVIGDLLFANVLFGVHGWLTSQTADKALTQAEVSAAQ